MGVEVVIIYFGQKDFRVQIEKNKLAKDINFLKHGEIQNLISFDKVILAPKITP